MKIGNTEFIGKAALAPLAGVADKAMREICINNGAAFCVTELISAKGITLKDAKSLQLMDVSQQEQPIGIQIFGNEPKTMALAAIEAQKRSPAFIDINMGCPAPKVASGGGGSSLLKTPKLCGKIVKECVKAVNLPITVKIRAGWDESSINAVEVAKYCEDAGALAITVHGRTRAQMYAPPVNIDIIKQVKNAVKVPVIGNGDIYSPQDAARMYEQTGCDMVMVGRGAMGAPWIFTNINAYLNHGVILPEPPLKQRMLTMLKQIELMQKYKPERVAFLEARKQTAYYMRGLKGAATLRKQCCSINTYEDVVNIVKLVLKQEEAENI